MIKSVILALAAIGLIIAGTGCGAGAIKAHAAAAEATRTANNAAADALEDQCTESRGVEIANDPSLTPEDAATRARAFADTCHRLEDAQHLFARSHSAWVGLLLRSIESGDLDVAESIRMARDLVRVYVEAAELAEGFDLELPGLPPLVLGLLGD